MREIKVFLSENDAIITKGGVDINQMNSHEKKICLL